LTLKKQLGFGPPCTIQLQILALYMYMHDMQSSIIQYNTKHNSKGLCRFIITAVM